MNTSELNKILEEHKIWIGSFGKSGSQADLRGADLREANLRGADLYEADLYGADLPELTFIITGERYFITIANGKSVRVGCQSHSIDKWRTFTKKQIIEMDGAASLRFYPRLLDIIDFYCGKGERPDWIK